MLKAIAFVCEFYSVDLETALQYYQDEIEAYTRMLTKNGKLLLEKG